MKRKILLIEDNLEMRENTTEILELADYVVVAASNGQEGVEMASKELPDLIICDIMMPIMDGYGVLNALSKNDQTSAIPFIFLTAKAERLDQRKGMEMGADDYLTKPFDDLELLNAVNTRLRKSDLLKRNFSRDINGLNDFMEAVKGMDMLNRLSNEKTLKTYKKKENIYLEGNIPRGIYFINSGKVKTAITNPDGKDLITGLYNTGDFFGYLALLEETKYTDTASALEDADICMIPKEDFYGLVYNSPDVSRKFIKMLSNDLAAKEDQLLQLAYNSVRKRVAEALLTLYNKYGDQQQENFSMKISREDLSNLVGTSTETVIRTLGDFKDEQLVELKGGLITILNPSKLSAMKNQAFRRNIDEDHFLGQHHDLILYLTSGNVQAGGKNKMNIIIDHDKKLASVKEEFNQLFPFLNLEFLENSGKTVALDTVTMGNYRKSLVPEPLYISPEMSVADLEKTLLENFDLRVRVLRKSGMVWLNTSHTDSWSLDQQNKQGEIVSAHLNKQNEIFRNR